MIVSYRPILLLLLILFSGCTLLPPLDDPRAAVPEAASVTPLPTTDPSCDISALEAAGERMTLLDADWLRFVVDATPQSDMAGEVDSETLADTLVLTGADQVPPDNEGLTTAATVPLYDFPVVENDKVRYFIDFYTGRGRPTFTRWLQRSGRFLPMIQQIFADYGLPRDLAYLAMVESGFNERAYSWAHAVGPWQFIESTARGYGLTIDWWYDERRDFEKSTHAAARFLTDLYQRFDGDWYLAVASYNAGGGKISRAIRMYDSRDFWTLSRGSFLQPETKNYLPKLLAVLIIAKQPEKYGFTGLEYLDPYAYEVVALPAETDLEVVARLSGADYDTIKTLNPELKRWCTPPGVKGYEIRLPTGTRERFVEHYAAMDPAERISYLRHQIRPGDTLLRLAKTHQIRVEDIVSMNNIRDPRVLRIGSDLILPLKPGYTARPLQELEDDYIRSRRTYYTVRSGDSLWKIAQKFSVTEKQLRVWNRLGWSNLLRPGQKLAVSAKGQKSLSTGKSVTPMKKVVYLVKSGDTLWDIGRRYAVPMARIRNWNNLQSDHILRPGDKLTLLLPDSHRG